MSREPVLSSHSSFRPGLGRARQPQRISPFGAPTRPRVVRCECSKRHLGLGTDVNGASLTRFEVPSASSRGERGPRRNIPRALWSTQGCAFLNRALVLNRGRSWEPTTSRRARVRVGSCAVLGRLVERVSVRRPQGPSDRRKERGAAKDSPSPFFDPYVRSAAEGTPPLRKPFSPST